MERSVRRLRQLAGSLRPPTTAPPAAAPTAAAGGLYQPASTGGEWETLSAAAGGWDAAKLAEACAFAREARSTGLLITVGGRILAEEYWPGSDAVNGLNASFPEGRKADDATDIASAQKAVNAILFGIAQDRGLLTADDAVSQHIPGWTHGTSEEEQRITIKHLLTMSTGLGPAQGQPHGPGGGGMHVLAAPDSVWEYNTVAYMTGTHSCLAAVGGMTLQQLTRAWLLGPIGCSQHSGWVARTSPGDPCAAPTPLLSVLRRQALLTMTVWRAGPTTATRRC